MIKNKLKELLSELKKFKVQAVLVLDYKKRNDCKFFHSSAKLVIQTLMKYLNSCIKAFSQKKKIYASKDWIFLDVIIKHSIKIFAC